MYGWEKWNEGHPGEERMNRRSMKWRTGGKGVYKRIVAKALDDQRYPLPLCECMWV